jgi:hypothetical protein
LNLLLNTEQILRRWRSESHIFTRSRVLEAELEGVQHLTIGVTDDPTSILGITEQRVAQTG